MASIYDFNYDEDNDVYTRRHKLSNGQFCMIGFQCEESPCGDKWDFNVVFAVADKKKQLNGYFKANADNTITLKSTGRCGIEALKWARDTIMEFEDALLGYEGQPITISVSIAGEDQRRFRMYERAMSRYGYKKVPGVGRNDYPWYMRKIVLDRGEIPQE